MYQGRRSHSVALTATDAVERPLLNIPEGHGFIEVASYDAFVWFTCSTVIDGVTRKEYAQLGPAGSKHLFKVCGNATVEYRVVHILGTTEHVDPATGVYTSTVKNPALTGRDAKVSAIYLDERPDTDQHVSISYGAGNEAAIAASDYSWGAYAPGYCRSVRFLRPSAGSATMWASLPPENGQAAIDVWDEVTTESGGGPIHPWAYVYIENTGALSLSCALFFSSDEE